MPRLRDEASGSAGRWRPGRVMPLARLECAGLELARQPCIFVYRNGEGEGAKREREEERGRTGGVVVALSREPATRLSASGLGLERTAVEQ